MSKLVTLNDLGYVNRGRSKHRPRNAPELYGGPYPFVQTADIKHADLYLTEYEQTYNEFGLAQSRLWPAGTLCITIAANIADTAILGCDACFPDSVIGFIPDDEKCDVRYVKYLFDTQLQTAFKQLSQGVAQDNLSKDKLLSIKFSVPDLPVQRRIADVLSAYDDLIENNRRRIAILEETARLTYRKWFGGTGQSWVAKHGKVSDFFDVSIGRTPPRKKEEYFSTELTDLKWLSIKDMRASRVFVLDTTEKLTKAGIEKTHIHVSPPGTIFLSFKLTVGEVVIAADSMATNEAIAHFETDDKALRDYTYFYLSSFQYDKLGSTSAIARAINSDIVRKIEFVLPTRNSLESFEKNVAPMLDQIEKLSKQSAALTAARDMLLPRLMKGQSCFSSLGSSCKSVGKYICL